MFVRAILLGICLLTVLAPTVLAEGDDHGPNGQGRGDRNEHGQGAQRQPQQFTINLASGLATPGTGDPNVTLTLPGAQSSAAAVVCSTLPSAWGAALSGSGWESNIADCAGNNAAAGNYTYAVTFTVPSGATNLMLTGTALADDSLTVSLNGRQLASGGNFITTLAFQTSDQSAFQIGTNTLQFVVNNIVSASGLDFVAKVNAANAAAPGQSGNNNENEGGDD